MIAETSAKGSTALLGKITLCQNQTAKLRITPITAAVMPVKGSRHCRNIDMGHGQVAKQQHNKERRNYEQAFSGNAAPRAVESPADVGRQLLRFRTRQQHAKVKRPEQLVFTDPVSTFDYLLMHDGNLTCRAAEAYKSQLGPKFNRFFKSASFIND
jgi:hypothetical protein